MLMSVIIDGARTTLIDASAVAWSNDELVGYANEAIRTICHVKKDAYPVRDYIPLVAGAKQQLPADGVAVLDGGPNEISGRVCTLVDRELLDAENDFWPAATRERDAQHWAADPRDPSRFDVTPPNDGSGSVQFLYGAIPAAVTYAGTLPLVDTYQRAIECFVLSRALAKKTRRQDPAQSAAYMEEFKQLIGLGSNAQIAAAPKLGKTPRT